MGAGAQPRAGLEGQVGAGVARDDAAVELDHRRVVHGLEADRVVTVGGHAHGRAVRRRRALVAALALRPRDRARVRRVGQPHAPRRPAGDAHRPDAVERQATGGAGEGDRRVRRGIAGRHGARARREFDREEREHRQRGGGHGTARGHLGRRRLTAS
jgi:hypothetical protein